MICKELGENTKESQRKVDRPIESSHRVQTHYSRPPEPRFEHTAQNQRQNHRTSNRNKSPVHPRIKSLITNSTPREFRPENFKSLKTSTK